MLSCGIFFVILSSIYASQFLAILGVSIIFWGALLLYVTPSKHAPLTLLNATADLSNIERILADANLGGKGVYLPPGNVESIESSLVYIPEKGVNALPKVEKMKEKLRIEDGILLTPPGNLLSRLFERELGYSFMKTELTQLQNLLPKLLVENMEIAESVQIKIQDKTINIEIMGSILDGVCQQTQELEHTHDQVGCALTSAIACALAKSSGKPITIQKEVNNFQTKFKKIEYRIEEE